MWRRSHIWCGPTAASTTRYCRHDIWPVSARTSQAIRASSDRRTGAWDLPRCRSGAVLEARRLAFGASVRYPVPAAGAPKCVRGNGIGRRSQAAPTASVPASSGRPQTSWLSGIGRHSRTPSRGTTTSRPTSSSARAPVALGPCLTSVLCGRRPSSACPTPSAARRVTRRSGGSSAGRASASTARCDLRRLSDPPTSRSQCGESTGRRDAAADLASARVGRMLRSGPRSPLGSMSGTSERSARPAGPVRRRDVLMTTTAVCRAVSVARPRSLVVALTV